MNSVRIKRALISVSDKTGVVEFARQLRQRNIEILSTGGTLAALNGANIDAKSISDVTHFPEILDGRVKTLHPKIHGGLLAIADNPKHQQQLAELDITPIDMVVVNLYPFEHTITGSGVSLDEAIEQIDIGGPAMIRAAAKNFKYKTVIVNPARYNSVAKELDEHDGSISRETRFELAKEVFFHTSRYDATISQYLESIGDDSKKATLPDVFSLSVQKSADLRYGENPHQRAALYGNFHTFFEKLHGKELSYNNIVDIQAAAELLEEFSEPTACIIKHTNPCGVGSGKTLVDAYEKALATDAKSAFGGIVAVNRSLDMDTAECINKIFTEVIIAPEFDDEVIHFLKKKTDRRLIRQRQRVGVQRQLVSKNIAGGVLVQTSDDITMDNTQMRVVTQRAPKEHERASMMFAWHVAKHVKSNAIVYAREDRTIGIGAGQMSRFDSSRIAAMKANDAGFDLHGTAVASDAFFPFADGLLEAVNAGATAVIQPGGSIRDNEVINAANGNNIAMVFTGIRHFKH
jgi:phosphoribosylaminoimidazolecarboxamide formyltransferase/IMP cyclohydrolase